MTNILGIPTSLSLIFSFVLSAYTIKDFTDNFHLYAQHNPGCAFCEDPRVDPAVLYIVHRNVSTSTHIIVSASRKFVVPSIILMQSSLSEAVIAFNWTQIVVNNSSLANSITIPSGSIAYGISFASLYPFDDDIGTAIISNGTRFSEWPLSSFIWQLFHWDTAADNSTGLLQVVYRSNYSEEDLFMKDGELLLKLTISTRDKLSETPPHLFLYAGLSVQVELVMRRLAVPYPNTRFGLAILLLSNKTMSTDDDFRESVELTINDELTPGVFKMTSIYLSASLLSSDLDKTPAFFQWKPVCYSREGTNLKRGLMVTSDRRIKPSLDPSRQINQSLPYALFGDRMFVNSTLPVIGWREQHFFLGGPGEELFVKSNYSSWTILFSLGTPYQEHFSPALWSLVITSAGLLGFTAVSVIAYIVLTRCPLARRRRYDYLHSPLIRSECSVNVKI